MKKLHLYLVRHCESLGNRENIFQGQLDLDISATGEKQLALLALRFRNIPIDAVYSSPLKRAYKTAEAVDLYHSLPIIKLPELMEVDVGALSGMKLDKAFADYPVFAEKWQNSPQNCIFPEGETTAEVYDRAKKALARVKADYRKRARRKAYPDTKGKSRRRQACYSHHGGFRVRRNAAFYRKCRAKSHRSAA